MSIFTNKSKNSTALTNKAKEFLILCDSYSESNQNTYIEFASGQKPAQSFTGDGKVLKDIELYLRNVSATGTGVVKIYAHTGTFGTDGTPTGAVLATSDSVDVSTISSSVSLIKFSFSGSDKIVLENGTHYFLVFEPTIDTSLEIGIDNSSPTHSGNEAIYIVGWTAFSGTDLIFYVYGDSIFTNKSKNSTSLTNKAKNSTSLTNKAKVSTTFTNRAK